MRVVVAEKPSVARDLARVLGASRKAEGFLEGNGLRITWCHGHMAELEEPAHYDAAWKKWSLETLPMVPAPFALRLRKNATDQFAVIKRLLRDAGTEDVVNACDAGREGELIFRYVAELSGCRKPVLRLWVSSLTDEAIRQAWGRLRPGADFDRLGDAARSRAEADWLVGLNATRALTVRGGADLLSVGRVQTPTLALIVARDREIDAFVPETFWQVRGTFDPDLRSEGGLRPRGAPPVFVATWFRPDLAKDEKEDERPADGQDPEVAHAERLPDEASARAVADAARGRIGRIEVAERKRTRERPPLLYDLTSLQRRANQRYGLAAGRTLEIAQALYERHKLITYPRTDARYLTPDQVPGLALVLRGLVPIGPYAPFATALLGGPISPGPRVVNAGEVGDHPAIIPTGKTPGGGLDADEKRVFDLVARRFMAVLMEDALFDVTRLVVAVPTDSPLPDGVLSPLRFRARGRVCRQEGWRAVDPPGKSADLDLPPVELGDPATAREVDALEGKTRPPRPYTDATVLRAMETAGKALDDDALERILRGRGLGTPATRAAILETLIERKYVVRKGKELHATDKGRSLVDAVPVDALKSAELTAEWEGRLSGMSDGRGVARPAFMQDVARHVDAIVKAIAGAAPPVLAADTDAPVLGACPKCGKPVRPRGQRFVCDGACGFVMYGTIAKRAISPRMVKQLLAEGRTPAVKGFKSKAGREFSAGLRWDPEQDKVALWFPDRDGSPNSIAGGAAPPVPSPKSLAGGAAPPVPSPNSLAGGAAPPVPTPPTVVPPDPRRLVGEGDRCPTCGEGTVIRGRKALGCSRWRQGCGFRA